MARRGGFGGGMGMPGNMNNLMKQAQRMQRQMEENKKALEEKEFTATAGGGAVQVVMTGAHEMKSITIDPDAVDPEDVETLQDMILVAVNDVLGQIGAENEKLMGGLGF
ncbi:MAG: YbaB/EbfC family nucleoid-associated protein [Eubacteriales bacterium]|nr:YbaB/EbfC family nucleoid-associated protein [Eubacteriales bacterium]